MAIEVHLMGACSGFYLLAYILYRREDFFEHRLQLLGKLAWFLAGVALGCVYYYALHHRYFELGAAWRGVSQHPLMAFPVKSYIVGYFFGTEGFELAHIHSVPAHDGHVAEIYHIKRRSISSVGSPR